MRDWLRNNAVGIVGILLTIGGAIGAFFSEALQIAADHGTTLLCLGLCLFSLGYVIGWYAKTLRSAEYATRPMRRKIRGFSAQKARAVLRAFNESGFAKLGDYENEVMASILNGEGLFVRPTLVYEKYGTSIPQDEYAITDRWRAFLRDDANMRELERIAKE